ncbi:MAG: fibronectin type III domain-containing protein [Candidatus Paceibacterota bacterium]
MNYVNANNSVAAPFTITCVVEIKKTGEVAARMTRSLPFRDAGLIESQELPMLGIKLINDTAVLSLLTGTNGFYTIQMIDNSNHSWSTLAKVALSTSSAPFIDTNSPATGYRFYRLQLLSDNLSNNLQVALSKVTLEWDASPDSQVDEYAIHYGTNSGGYTTHQSVGNYTQVTVSNLLHGVTYYFVATAYTTNGLESMPSNEVSYTPPLNR